MLQNRSIPAVTVIPVLLYPDVAEAAGWLCRAFDFSVRLKIGDHRVQLNVGNDGALVVAQGTATGSNSIMVRIEHIDSHYTRALQNGAESIAKPETFPYGERQYSVNDFAGHHWTFTESVADVDPEDWGGRLSLGVLPDRPK